ncbi:DUF2304 domain-containing protein [Pseudarthrobacter sp. SL88]|uniref:DUF2304 domain-containing protein n=1 Tax=Micrococcaceae TaxID=1268 RepID=UPI0006FD687A|nr:MULTISPECIES: DUF2304 domain-containing protein [Micrococcaceae]KQQ80324.1 hypothetical protein ASF64_14230 [Arthrobacter sp. Leaf137]MCT9624489.1 DUF2304 domain-containing protein [Pseudarthrobacter equi]MCY1674287.1 DUF2304 domain-containing protein [Pseudarthrobacter sp. SL88]MDQ1055477.1 hypothetical protein [Arthrobacter sp. SORGH_AS_0212]
MATLVGFIFVLVILLIIFEMLRRRHLREKYAVIWIIIGIGVLVLVAFPQLLFWSSGVLGVKVPSNLLFAMAIVLLVSVCLHLSFEQSQAEDEVRVLAEEVGILRLKVLQLEESLAQGGTAAGNGTHPETLPPEPAP